ncbi:hypothetical protein H3146_05935 [Streptomyces sp. OF3]|uniref:Uncharacterized protein n=1 Tax=Streptomyces alkaliterrae TaxID=2213162 RepID=A0A7W3WIG0_9ACTN|nr:hypothetical protein [Streptomyces alkaliterrae]MBB1252907.1 hypothetical protein [Streptomyces alkaliterrae]
MPLTVPQPALTQAVTPAESRIVTASLRGARIPIECPTWCTISHAAVDLAHIEDLEHEGTPVSIRIGCEERVMQVSLNQWPFSRQPEPHLAVEATYDSETEALPPAAALAFADQLAAHADTIRRLAATLGGAA